MIWSDVFWSLLLLLLREGWERDLTRSRDSRSVIILVWGTQSSSLDQGDDHGGREDEVLRQQEARPGRKFAYEGRQKGSKGPSREPPRWARNEGKSQGWGRQSWQAAGRVAVGLLFNFIPIYKHCPKPDLSNLVSTVSSVALEVKCEGSFNSWVQFSVCGYMSMFMRGAHGRRRLVLQLWLSTQFFGMWLLWPCAFFPRSPFLLTNFHGWPSKV